MKFLSMMNPVCYGMIGYLLSENNITVRDLTFWMIFILIIVIQVATALSSKEALNQHQNDTQ